MRTRRQFLEPLLVMSVFYQSAVIAAEPLLTHEKFSGRDSISLRFYEDAATQSGLADSKPLFDNADRVHLTVRLREDGSARFTLFAPAVWSEAQAVSLANDILRKLRWRVMRRRASQYRNTWLVLEDASGVARREGYLFRAPMDLPAVFAALRSAGVERVELRFRSSLGRKVEHSDAGFTFTPYLLRGLRPFLMAVVPTDIPVKPVTLTYGYTIAQVRRSWALYAVLLVAPIVLLSAMRSRALRRPGDEQAYQGYMRWRRGLVLLVVVGNTLALTRLDIFSLVTLSLGPVSSTARTALLLGFLIVVPTVVLAAMAALSQRVEEQFRGLQQTPRTYLLRSLLPVLLLTVPVVLMILGMAVAPNITGPFLFGKEGQAGLLGSPILFVFVLAFFFAIINRVTMVKLLQPRPLEEGELPSRILALCRKAGVNVTQVFLARTERHRVANAFVTSTGAVTLTDYLVRRCTREEVDAVVSHELAHLRLHHLPRQMAVQGLGVLLWLGLVGALRAVLPEGRWNSLVVWTFWIVPPLVYHFVSRRHELQADAEAVALTGDAAAYVRMLKKLAALNTQPLRLSRLDEATGTHPAAARRLHAVAARAGLGEAQVQALLAEADASLTATAESAAKPLGYELPAEGQEAGDYVFSRRRRTRVEMTSALLGCLPLLGFMALALTLMKVFVPSGKGWLAGTLCIGGIVLGFAALIVASQYISLMTPRRLRPLLAKKVKDIYGVDPTGALLVGYSPGEEFRLYAGNTNWDHGFLLIERSRLRYLGDRISFELRPESLRSLEVRDHGTGFVGRVPRLCVRWAEDTQGDSGVFSLEVCDVRSVRAMHPATRQLQERLEAWRKAPFAERSDAGGPPQQITDDAQPAPAAGKAASLELPRQPEAFSAPLPAPATMGWRFWVAIAGVMTVLLAVFLLAMLVVKTVWGKEALRHPLLRWGPIVAFPIIVNILTAYMNARRRTQTSKEEGHGEGMGERPP